MKKRHKNLVREGMRGPKAERSTNKAKLEVRGKNTAEGKQKPTHGQTPAAAHLDPRFSVHKLHSIRK